MGSSRSHAADMEDTVVKCKYGVERMYFDTCYCAGCKSDRERHERASRKADSIRWIALKFFENLPEEQWNSVVSLRIK
jgi:hypothetical protein